MATTAKPMPIGVDDFAKLIQGSYYFIDKTMFIQELLRGHGDVILITRPRRFGKTLNLSMLRYFFTLEKAEENRQLFKGLEIEKTDCMAEQGSRPVVFLTLKGVQSPNYPLMLESLQELLRTLYGKFRYVLQTEEVAEDDKAFFRRILEKSTNHAETQTALKHLLHCLSVCHSKKPLLLMDEYDAPILAAWEKGYYKECIDFMRVFLGEVLKTNEALDFAVLTGVTRVSKESIFSDLNNLKVCSVLSNHFSDFFGFTQTEVNHLMHECGKEDQLENLKKWYDGYRFGSSEIYNPWSVIQFVDNDCRFLPYWLNTSDNSILRVLLEHIDSRRKKELEGLLRGKPVKTQVMENIIYGDIEADSNTLFMMLLTSGYLKAVEVWQDENFMEWAKLQIPNREILQAFRDEIFRNAAPHKGYIVLHDMLEAMTEGNAEDFAEYLSELLTDFVSFHDLDHSPESFYHGLLLGFSVLLESTYRVESNRESGYGRFDIAFFPHSTGKPGILLEIKAVKTREELEKAAKEALGQIRKKAYLTELNRQGVKEVWIYGIAFCGKRLWLERG